MVLDRVPASLTSKETLFKFWLPSAVKRPTSASGPFESAPPTRVTKLPLKPADCVGTVPCNIENVIPVDLSEVKRRWSGRRSQREIAAGGSVQVCLDKLALRCGAQHDAELETNCCSL